MPQWSVAAGMGGKQTLGEPRRRYRFRSASGTSRSSPEPAALVAPDNLTARA